MNMAQFLAKTLKEQHTFILEGNTITDVPALVGPTISNEGLSNLFAECTVTEHDHWEFTQYDLECVLEDVSEGYYESGACYDTDLGDYIEREHEAIQKCFMCSLLCEDYFA